MSILSQVLHCVVDLLASGGDDRQTVIAGSEKLNKYHCSSLPRNDIIRRGSCTCSTVDASDFLIAEKCKQDLLTSILRNDSPSSHEMDFDASFQKIISRLNALFHFSGEMVLFPSGSDAEYISVVLALMQSLNLLSDKTSNVGLKVFNNVIAAGEVGSGTYWAASGQYFNSLTPSGEACSLGTILNGIEPGWIEGVQFIPRNENGVADLREAEIIDTIHQQMSSSSTSVSVLHLVLGSKTGLLYPRWEKVQTLQITYQQRLVVVVDACQFRCEPSALTKFVESGCVVMFTGSKFYCGPPFSGGVLLPLKAVETIEKSLEEPEGPASALLPAGIASFLSYHQVSSGLPLLRKRLKHLRPNYANVGLYLRWCVAVNTMEAHSMLPAEQVSGYQDTWTKTIRSLFSQHREYLSELKEDQQSDVVRVKGIINIQLSVDDTGGRKRLLGLEECRVFHLLMTLDLGSSSSCNSSSSDPVTTQLAQLLAVLASPSEGITLSARAMIGQPVCLSSSGGLAVVRLALGADMVLRMSRGDLFTVTSEDIKVMYKMWLLLKHWAKISALLAQTAAVVASPAVSAPVTAAPSVTDRMAAIDSALCVSEAEPDSANTRLSQSETISTVLQTHFVSPSQLPDVSVLYDLTALDRNISLATSAFSRLCPARYVTRHCFAVKSCPLTYLLHYVVSHRGTGLECASLCEVMQALRVGCEPVYIIFDCPCKSRDDIYFALSHHVTLNANSYAELSKIKECLERLRIEGRESRSIIGLRVNPMVGGGANAALSTATASSKFGIPLLSKETIDDTPAAVLAAVQDYTEQIVQCYVDHPFLTAIMCHVGSQGMPLRLMSLGAKRILALADLIDSRCISSEGGGGGGEPARIKMVDIGGGISANYTSDEVTPSFGQYADDLLSVCPSLQPSATSAAGRGVSEAVSKRILITEFGKGLIAKCGYITSRIEDVLRSPTNSSSVVAIGHAGADLLLRTAYCAEKFPHRVILLDENKKLLNNDNSTRTLGTVTIAGPLCFSGDIVASELSSFPLPVAGDICVVLDAGANTLSLFSRHCSRMSPRVFAFRGNHLTMISEGEKEEDVLRFWD